MSKVILVTGGARSGKSSYGEKLARITAGAGRKTWPIWLRQKPKTRR